MNGGSTCFQPAAACCLYTHTSAGRVHLSREPWDGAAGIQIAGALGGSLWQCQATVLWDPEGVTSGIVAPLKCFPAGQVLDDWPVASATAGLSEACLFSSVHLSREPWDGAAGIQMPEPWEGASGNARQLFYGIPKATCQVTSGVTSGIVLLMFSGCSGCS